MPLAEVKFSKGGPREGDLRFWWIPQVPGDPFHVTVKNVEEAKLLYSTLADYDQFQFEQRVKPDYSNAGGLEEYRDGEWSEWHDEETDYDLAELLRQ